MDSDVRGLFFIDTKSKASPSNFHEPVEDTDSFQIITTGLETEEAKHSGSYAIKQKTRILGIDDEEEELEQLVFGAKAERLIGEEEEGEELGDQIQINKTDDFETWRDESRTLEVSGILDILPSTKYLQSNPLGRSTVLSKEKCI